MSTFGGLVEEIPGISVDRFDSDNLKSSVFFLSHCHTDHMQGLGADFFQELQERQQYLYCTPISKAILVSNPYNRLNGSRADTIRVIDGCSPVIICCKQPNEGKETYLTVTCVPAGHCPGSVMFVFENSSARVLYTGDFRIDANDFSKLKPLHENINGRLRPKMFDNIYLDTTFFTAKSDYFPSRRECLKEMCKVVKDWIAKDTENIVILECSANYGPEHLFIELANALNVRIHVKDVVYQSYTLIPELVNCVTNSPSASAIHACVRKNNRKFCKNGLPCRPGVKLDSIMTIVPSVYRWKNEDLTKNIVEWDNENRRYYVCYSCHASRGELLDFIKYFHPTKLYPCVCPIGIEFSDFQMQLNQLLERSDSKKLDGGCYLNLSKYKAPSKTKLKTLTLSDDDEDD